VAPAAEADRGDLADPEAPRRVARWQAVEALRARFGEGAVMRGRGLRPR
jgi:DNA polymerase-4